MVSITRQDNKFLFKIKGMHKLWALKSEFVILAVNVLDAHQDFSDIGWWKGWRAPGTQIPFLITAGTYYLNGDKIFWDVVYPTILNRNATATTMNLKINGRHKQQRRTRLQYLR